MNSKPTWRAIAAVPVTVIAILLGACGGSPTAFAPAEPSPTLIAPTNTPILPTETPTPTAPKGTPTRRPTSVPGTKFGVTAEGLKLELEVHECNLQMISDGSFTNAGPVDDVRSMMDLTEKFFEPGQAPIAPQPGEDAMCWMKGKVLEGSVTDTQSKTWINEGAVYLLDQAGNKSNLVYLRVIPEEQAILLLFSAPHDYAPAQIQMLDVLVDLP